jgi:hypothetical protein
MIRKYLMVLLVVFLSIISICSATAKSSPEEAAKYVANFNYTPNSQAVPGSAGVTFAIGKVSYQSGIRTPWFSDPQFANFDKAIKEDLSKLLIARGFSVRGPFDAYDLIPYPDKKAIDLYLVPTLELLFTSKGPKDLPKGITGNMAVTGKIILELREIVTGELMWSKRIPITKFEFPYKGGIIWGAGVTVADVMNKEIDKSVVSLDSVSINDVAKGIEKQYLELMDTISKLIDPEEMRIIKKQAQELKSKKGY